MMLPQRFVIAQFGFLALFAAAWLFLPRSAPPIAIGIGFGLIIVAIAILMLAVAEFQRHTRTLPNITPTPNRQTGLVQTGIYKSIRHPIYTAVLSGVFGAALMHGELLVFVLAFVLLGFFTIKSMYEEQLLKTAFPEYLSYMTRTRRFLPFF